MTSSGESAVKTPEDFFGEHGSRQEFHPNGNGSANGKHHPSGRKFIGITGAALDMKQFPPLHWIIPRVVPEGFFLLAGRVKLGKSWMLMDWSSAIALGGCAMGSIQCEPGNVLHLALEDNERRLKERQTMLLGNGLKPEFVEYNVTWPRIGSGGIEEMDKWADSVPNPRAIFIDVIKMVRRQQQSSESLYDYDYSTIEPLRDLANRRRLAIVGTHHLNKRLESDDPFDLVSGSNGMSAAADGTFILDRDGQGCTLYGRGRDIPESDRALSFDKTTGRWTLLGNTENVRTSDERTLIIDALANIGEPASPSEIAGATGQKYGNVRFLLHKMMKDGQVSRAGRGLYSVAPTSPSNNANSLRGDRD
jgi:hypothetical protein